VYGAEKAVSDIGIGITAFVIGGVTRETSLVTRLGEDKTASSAVRAAEVAGLGERRLSYSFPPPTAAV